jgi:beta-galactosidase
MPETKIEDFTAPAFEKDRLSYLLKENVQTPPLTKTGEYRVRLALSGHPAATHECSLLVVDPAPAALRPLRIGMAGVAPAVEACLRAIPNAVVESFDPQKHYDVIVGSGGSSEASKNLAVDSEGAYKPGPGAIPESTLPQEALAAVQAGTPLLAVTPTDGQSIGVAKQLAALNAFQFKGMVGSSRASWMGSWYFVRKRRIQQRSATATPVTGGWDGVASRKPNHQVRFAECATAISSKKNDTKFLPSRRLAGL